MLEIPSDIEGKEAFFGEIQNPFDKEGFHICGGWEYSKAYFDAILSQDGGETIYLRLPAHVVQGKLDQADARLEFKRPFVIKHLVHTGIVEEDGSDSNVPSISGLNQFQEPLDPDDRIENEEKWRQAGEQALKRIKPFVH